MPCGAEYAPIGKLLQLILFADAESLEHVFRSVESVDRTLIDDLKTRSSAYGNRYYDGAVTVDTVLKAVVKPYLRLARVINQRPVIKPAGMTASAEAAFERQQQLRDQFLLTWQEVLHWSLGGQQSCEGMILQCPGLTRQKRACCCYGEGELHPGTVSQF